MFQAAYAPPDDEIAARFLAADATFPGDRAKAYAARLIERIRGHATVLPDVEALLHSYSLSTKEGLALMALAEALLRVSDDATADRLIEDKLSAGDWSHRGAQSTALVAALGWTLGFTARVLHTGETEEGVLSAAARRLGTPAVRSATRAFMRLLGAHFVLGEDIERALHRASANEAYLYSFDMLGEGARTAADAERYFRSYASAIEAIGRSAPDGAFPKRPGISVKLSALHPRYDARSRDRVLAELTPKVMELALLAKGYDLNFTIDAEEADRLELSLEVIDAMVTDGAFAGWDGFGFAVQAYQKRAEHVVGWAAERAADLNRRFAIRLVKGAYWDTEIKRAQERGLSDYPVFTRKAMTDLSYEVCAQKLLAARQRLFPQFATHNALTVATLIEMAGGVDGYEFQRLHGMGAELYDAVLTDHPRASCRIYAPVGGHRDLLAYLVRRLLENGANSSFVAHASDASVAIADLTRLPRDLIGSPDQVRHARIPMPRAIYEPERKASRGIEFGDRAQLDDVIRAVASARIPAKAGALIDGVEQTGIDRRLHSPIDGSVIGAVSEADEAIANLAVDAAVNGYPAWNATPLALRAAALERTADLIDSERAAIVALLQREGGKTLDDAVAEAREAEDFCRYYAAHARQTLATRVLPGPTGERNELRSRGRGVFVCISPWNFPLAIFIGQVAAALVSGNAVVAKPAEQTPLMAALAVSLLHKAGVPKTALHLVLGGARAGSALVAHPRIAGVAFTGSTDVAQTINRVLAEKSGPIVPLVAETGGINAMVVDTTALPEQVTDDVVTSAFRSAGQRCSALRLLCLQDEIAGPMIDMIAGAAAELKLGDPADVAVDVGPVIDAEAKAAIDAWISAMERKGNIRFRWDAKRPLPASGTYVAPAIVELGSVAELQKEVFGPVLHVLRWRSGELDRLVADIAATGYALTLGIQSRIDRTVDDVVAATAHGNIYVNRSIIGAVVGTQPFGGSGLSGTGPKAGGPHYLQRFALEQTVTENTSAAGGNASLLAQDG